MMANKSIGHKCKSIMSKKLPNTSEIPKLPKATFADILSMFSQGKVKLHAQILN